MSFYLCSKVGRRVQRLLIILREITDFRIDHSETDKSCLMKLSVSGIRELLSSFIFTSMDTKLN
jgi:hypothetical protein